MKVVQLVEMEDLVNAQRADLLLTVPWNTGKLPIVAPTLVSKSTKRIAFVADFWLLFAEGSVNVVRRLVFSLVCMIISPMLFQ